MSELAEIQEKILESQNLLLRVEIMLLYPHVGGYAALPFDPTTRILELPRPTELKALWRWWARVLLSAAYGGAKDYLSLDEKVADILGMRGKEISKFTIRITIDHASFRKRFLEVYENNKQILENMKEDLKNIFNSFAEIGNEKCYIKSVCFRSFKSIQINFGGKIDGLNHVFRRENIKLIIRNNKLNITPDKIEELEKINKRIVEKVNKNYQELISNVSKYFKYGDIARLFIVSQGKGFEEIAVEKTIIDACESVKMTVDVFASRPLHDIGSGYSLDEIRFALYSFIIALIFGSIGYASRRGFGSIVVENINDGKALWILAESLSAKDVIKEDVEYIKKLIFKIKSESLPENIEASLQELLQKAVDIVAQAIGRVSKTGMVIPKVPTLLLNSYFKFKVFKCNDPLQSLHCISEACLKDKWKNLTRATHSSRLHTWILGLPRGTNRGVRRGYLSKKGNRRPSAIHFKILKNARGTYIVVYGFLSEDWPVDSLYHYSPKYGEGVLVTQLDVARPSGRWHHSTNNKYSMLTNVFNTAFEFIERIIKDCCKKGGCHA